MTDRFLANRHALVTGATSGIGLAIARALSAAGARVSFNGFGSAEQIEQAKAEIAAAGELPAAYFDADLRQPSAIEAMVDAANQLAAIDIVVNCAGMQHAVPISEMPTERWDALIAVNLSAAFHTMRLTLPGKWLSAHPLTMTDLEQEIQHLREADFTLVVLAE